jgi:hypothetical protein
MAEEQQSSDFGYDIDFSTLMEEEIQDTKKNKKWSPSKGEKNR